MKEKESLIKNLTSEQRSMVVEKLADFLYQQEQKKKALEKLSKI